MEGTYPIVIDGKKNGELVVTKSGLMTEFSARCTDTGGIMRLSVYGESEGYLGVMVPDSGFLGLRKRLTKSAMTGFPLNITHAGLAGMGAAPQAIVRPKPEEPEPETAPPDIEEECPEKIPPEIEEEYPEQIPPETEEERPEETPPEIEEECPEQIPPEVEEERPEEIPPEIEQECPEETPPEVEEEYPEQIPPETEEERPEETPPEVEQHPLSSSPSPIGNTNPEDLAMPVPEYIVVPVPEPIGNAPIPLKPSSNDTIWYPEPTPWSLFSNSAIKAAFSSVRGALASAEDGTTLLAIPCDNGNTVLGELKVKETRNIEGIKYAIFKVENGRLV